MNGPQDRRPAESPSCPLLGLPDDPVSRFSYPSVAHRCRASDRPRPIDLGHQGAFCLAATYPDCPRYQAAAAPRRSGGTQGAAASLGAAGAPGPLLAADTTVTPDIPSAPERPAMPWTLDRSAGPASRTPVNAPAPPDRPALTDPPKSTRGRRGAAVAIAITALVVLAVAAYLASPAIGDWVRQVGASAETAGPSLVVSGSSTPVPTLTTPLPGSSPTADPSPAATPTPTPTPTRVGTRIIHVVAKGEFLIGIAARYGVPVEAIIRANGLKDPGLIYVGERLVIPPP
jgi:LysM repeat protein